MRPHAAALAAASGRATSARMRCRCPRSDGSRAPSASTRSSAPGEAQRHLANGQLPAHLLVDGQVAIAAAAVGQVEERSRHRRREAAAAIARRSHRPPVVLGAVARAAPPAPSPPVRGTPRPGATPARSAGGTPRACSRIASRSATSRSARRLRADHRQVVGRREPRVADHVPERRPGELAQERVVDVSPGARGRTPATPGRAPPWRSRGPRDWGTRTPASGRPMTAGTSARGTVDGRASWVVIASPPSSGCDERDGHACGRSVGWSAGALWCSVKR